MAKKDYNDYTREQLVDELIKLNKRKKYGLVWEEEKTKEKFEAEAEGKLPVLVEDKKREIKTDESKPTHILIEGDNYHALSVLNYTHAKSIDVIYIDPPYNTGNNDFKYNDKFVDHEDSYRHSKWLSFMSKRLKLAKNLLNNSGIIFISIDDNEQGNLKLLCDEIFGEGNFHGTLTWVKRTKSTNSGKAKYMIQPRLEYIHCYGKINKADFNGFKLLNSDKEKKYPHKGLLGSCRFENLEATDYGRKKRNTMKFPILGIKPREGKRWQVGEDEATELVNQKRIEIIEGIPKRAVYPEDEESYSFVPFWAHLDDTGSAEEGKKELSDIIGPEHNFDTVKPVNLIKRILERFNDKITILDFFAGSGTTGHAVLELNKDEGNRQFILCTNNENNICTEICYPRVKKVIQGYESKKGKNILGLGSNLKYYKTNFVGSEQTHRNKKLLTDKSIEMLCIKENTFDEVLNRKDIFIFKNKDKFTAILFDELKMDEFKNEIRKFKKPISVYVFSLEGDDFKEDFLDLKNDITLCSIPEAILKVYRRIFGIGQMKLKM
ncbi:MAG: site-specific DNA-methyltransferase [Bacteroidota bacterium]